MSRIFSSIKNSLFGSKKPQYRKYQHGQLKIIAMKTRICLQQNYKKLSKQISSSDSQLHKFLQADNIQIYKKYQILQQIGQRIIQLESLKIYIQICRKIQTHSAYIITSNGDILMLKNELKWFQCILWYRQCKHIQNIQQLYTFCLNFFHGVDITMQLNIKCQIFQIYPVLKYLADGVVLPINILFDHIKPYFSLNLKQEEINKLVQINVKEIKQLYQQDKKQYKERLQKSKSPRRKNITPTKMRNIPNGINVNLNNQNKNISSSAINFNNNHSKVNNINNSSSINPINNNTNTYYHNPYTVSNPYNNNNYYNQNYKEQNDKKINLNHTNSQQYEVNPKQISYKNQKNISINDNINDSKIGFIHNHNENNSNNIQSKDQNNENNNINKNQNKSKNAFSFSKFLQQPQKNNKFQNNNSRNHSKLQNNYFRNNQNYNINHSQIGLFSQYNTKKQQSYPNFTQIKNQDQKISKIEKNLQNQNINVYDHKDIKQSIMFIENYFQKQELQNSINMNNNNQNIINQNKQQYNNNDNNTQNNHYTNQIQTNISKINEKKKFIKKPYMISIYARKQYVQDYIPQKKNQNDY